ncbi:polyphosphate polymerase domain-containing protein [Acidaminobacter sp. JC074]|uniref:polyphosphate polymerase domain-containing protein n=1 Tax=Acidaminobacter sp. JC074 TaxID=2530199 RepID=UPI001F0FEAE9|nr:polyphosphate polymerase domain-containing protein [Acidaminobacter sp. JC074]MCH4886633.1 polyphosphate polymerase domain-containing protein [Acidaminobacter sp. JC074]
MRIARTETKYRLSADKYGLLLDKLTRLLEADEHNGPFGYTVTSLYFDSVLNKDYYDKIDGLENRKKIRLRFYNRETDQIKLEMKIKDNTYQAKESMLIYKGDAILLQEGEYDCLLKYQDPFADKIRHIMTTRSYRPVVKIQYTRRAFIGEVNATRITFDYDLRVSETSLDLFESEDYLERIPTQFFAILEVKSTGELPHYIKTQLAPLTESSRAVSKYRESRWLFEELNIL